MKHVQQAGKIVSLCFFFIRNGTQELIERLLVIYVILTKNNVKYVQFEVIPTTSISVDSFEKLGLQIKKNAVYTI